ncbi:MAG TPA: 3-hydroxyacyl-CoA dehydrogenase/enoyl-CoA hydratase family protein [Myxococcota bacterium]|nr:3-hydroxyacyl-CoA dehydrogenase/enoyl-CoA hydratase family protein [Myxococcota bacterium]
MQALDVKRHGQKAITRVSVIGAGVMGQAIAAHMINAGLDCLLLDMRALEGDKNQITKEAVKKIRNSKPPLLYSKSAADLIKIGNIEDDLSRLKDCDLIIEAVYEKIDIKQALFRRLEKCLTGGTIVASNTSGLSIAEMLHGMSREFCERFLVMHFFNPVRYLHLLEIVPSANTKKEYVDAMVRFGEDRLGKGVVIGKDTTNFIANRIGVYGMMEAMSSVLLGGYSIEEVDAVFGPALGRPKSAIFRTADVVGLDTFIHVAKNCFDHLKDDECRSVFQIPDFLHKMVQNGWLGQKSGQGFYKKEGDAFLAIDPKSLTYHEKAKVRFDSLGAIRNMASLTEKLGYMAYADDRAGQLFFDLTAKVLIYAANRLFEIADNIVDIDNALKWGFGWELGPFETWDAIGVRKSASLMESKGLNVPGWVKDMLRVGRENFYEEDALYAANYYCPSSKSKTDIKTDNREWKIECLKKDKTKLVADADAYSLVDAGNGALIVEFHSKMNAIDQEILQGINDGIDRCEAGKFEALVLANDGANFSVGANLLLLYMAASQGLWQEIDDIVRLFQNTSKRLRYCSIPTVSAPFQLTLGGGCELSMWCDKIHAHAETYIGLVEFGVGLIPGGGGNIAMVARTLKGVPNTPTFVTEPFLMRALETVAMAKVATSAEEAGEFLYLADSDSFSMNRRFQLHNAAAVAVSMAKRGYVAPRKRMFRLPGINGLAAFDVGLRSMLGGQFISEYDYFIAKKVAHVMTGGHTNSYQEVTEDYLLDLEREAFLSLCGEKKTMARIAHMLEHNKPLRN